MAFHKRFTSFNAIPVFIFTEKADTSLQLQSVRIVQRQFAFVFLALLGFINPAAAVFVIAGFLHSPHKNHAHKRFVFSITGASGAYGTRSKKGQFDIFAFIDAVLFGRRAPGRSARFV